MTSPRLTPEPQAPGHVLVVEDDDALRDVLCLALVSAGHDVGADADAEGALVALRARDFDVLVTDVRLGGMSGLDLLAHIQGEGLATEVILISGQISPEEAVGGLRAGAFDYLQKPVAASELRAAVERAIERRRLRALNALFEASRAAFRDPDPAKLPRVIVEVAMGAMAADDASLMLADVEGQLHLVYSHTLSQQIQATASTAVGDGVAGRVAQDGRPALLNTALADDPRFAGTPARARVRSSIVLPLFSGARLVGVLNLNRLATLRPFREPDLTLAAELATQAVLALDNTRLFRDLQVRLRELQVTQARLVESEQLAAVGQVAAGIAHALNNPASYILSNLWTIDESLDALLAVGARLEAGADRADCLSAWRALGGADAAGDLREAVREALDGARRIGEILGDVSALAQPATIAARQASPPAGPPAEERADVNAAIRSALRLVRAAVEAHARLEVHLGPAAAVEGDPGRLAQLFLNLLLHATRAVAAAPEQPHRITLSTRRSEGEVRVRLTDTGAGVLGQHEGLGLRIVREIVGDHGGSLEVDAQAGVGSSYTLSLPAAPPDDAPGDGASVAMVGRPARLLFVESDAASRRARARQFGRDHEITVVDGVGPAMEVLSRRGDLDLVLCELSPPRLLGARLHRRMAEDHAELIGRLVFVTDPDPSLEVRAFLRGVQNAALSRPLHPERLLALARGTA